MYLILKSNFFRMNDNLKFKYTKSRSPPMLEQSSHCEGQEEHMFSGVK